MAAKNNILPSFVSTPLKVIMLASLPLIVGVEIGDRALADPTEPQGISSSLAPIGEVEIDLSSNKTYQQALAEGYRSLSATLEDSAQSGKSPSDWADSQYFMLRSMAAARGDDEGPEQLSNWSIPDQAIDDFIGARSRILEAAEDIETAENNVSAETIYALAEAQISFDCWIERSEEQTRSDAADNCRTYLYDALMRLKDAKVE